MRVTRQWIVLVSAVLLSCGGSEESAGPDAGPVRVVATPTSGPPGTILELQPDGALGSGAGELFASIGGRTSPVVARPGGGYRTVIPIFADQGWHLPPAEPVQLQLFRGELLVGEGEAPITVGPLPEAPGTLASVCEGLVAVAAISTGALAPPHQGPGEHEAYTEAHRAVVDWLLDDPDMGLHAAVDSLASQAPQALAELDAMLAASGLAARLELAAADLGHLAAQLQPARRATPATIGDLQLARQMQLHLIATQFGEEFVHASASQLSMVVGAWALSRAIPSAVAVSTLLSVADLVFNKYVLARMPAHLESLDLSFPSSTVQVGGTAGAEIELRAANDPPAVTWNDLIGVLSAAMGVAGSGSAAVEASLAELLGAIASVYAGALTLYADSHPSLALNLELGTPVPAMQWRAVATTRSLFELSSTDTQALPVDEGGLDWYGRARGSGFVEVRTSQVGGHIDPPPGFEYNGGAFGEDAALSQRVELVVDAPMTMEVDFASTISEGGINTLDIRAGHLGGDGSPDHGPGIDIALAVEGGAASPSSGSTDASGNFAALVQHHPGNSGVVVTITATDDRGGELVRTVRAQLSTGSDALGTFAGTAQFKERAGSCGGPYEDPARPAWLVVREADADNYDLRIYYDYSSNTCNGVGGWRWYAYTIPKAGIEAIDETPSVRRGTDCNGSGLAEGTAYPYMKVRGSFDPASGFDLELSSSEGFCVYEHIVVNFCNPGFLQPDGPEPPCTAPGAR